LIRREKGELRHIDGYFPDQRNRVSWVHIEESRSLLILSTLGPDGETQEQAEVPLAHAHALLDVCAGQISYVRTAVPVGEHYVLVDEVMRPQNLHLVSVEFDSDEQARAFRPMAWFGPEVTRDPRFSNRSIALQGLDEVIDVPITDAQLNSLIDTLEGRILPPSQKRIAPPKSNQGPTAKPAGGYPGEKANLAELEAAMMREMESSLHRNRPG
ncbi:CYTH domain-containing protein, partial [Microvirga roseola]|uniref:hypothetical protein n=1 Tax=Microvirga roseola TaxID=2883126 RepID=UPI001E394399